MGIFVTQAGLLDVANGLERTLATSGERVRLARRVWRLAKHIRKIVLALRGPFAVYLTVWLTVHRGC